jgi:hypothetical protein
MAALKAQGKVFGRTPSILGYPKRVAKLRQLDNEGVLRTEDGFLAMPVRDLWNEMNKADKKAPHIKNVETIRRWYRDGMPGLEIIDEEGV